MRLCKVGLDSQGTLVAIERLTQSPSSPQVSARVRMHWGQIGVL